MEKPPLILAIEDEADILELLRFNLDAQGWRISGAATGEQGLQKAISLEPDLILLDLMLPGINGIEVAKRIRATPQISATPIIMLTARGEEDDVVAGLDAGADDYVVKPFSLKVLLARVRRQLARPAEATESERQLIQRPGLIVDADRHKVLVEGQEVTLTSSEFKALFFMASKPGRIFTRNQIMEAVHGEGYIVTERAIDVMIVGLRRKLEGLGEQIETVRGVGYRMAEPA